MRGDAQQEAEDSPGSETDISLLFNTVMKDLESLSFCTIAICCVRVFRLTTAKQTQSLWQI